MTALTLDGCAAFEIGPGPEWFKERDDWIIRERPPVTLLCQHCDRLTSGRPQPPPAPLDELFRKLLDLIAGECRRAGMLP